MLSNFRLFGIMKQLTILFIILINFKTYGQKGTDLPINQLHQALINKDSAQLQQLLNDSLVYTHSNAWSENKKEVWKNLKSGYLVYNEIKPEDYQESHLGNIKILRYKLFVNVDLEGKNYQMRLYTMQTWIKKGKKWQLLSRLSTKLPT
jgi:hypothetical protein